MASVQEVPKQLMDWWSSLPAGRRLAVAGSTLAAIAAFGALVVFSASPNYVPLLTNLAPDDAATITQRLKEQGVPYELSSGGTAILVPEERVHDIRMTLASEGLPKGGGVGFEIFDEPRMGMSRFGEQLNYRRALEGELRRTIRDLDAVKDARVHIVLPERTLFAAKKFAASASVTVKLHPGRPLGGEQTQAVAHLVASSVTGLNAKDVTIVDSQGNILAKGGVDPEKDPESIQQQRELERKLEQRVIDIIERAVGRGHVTAHVTADMDFTQRRATKEKYDPDSAVARSSQTTDEQRGSGAAGAPQGIPGARSNLVGAQKTPAGLATSNSRRRSETLNYEIDKVVTHEKQNHGILQRLSVAVLVNAAEQTDSDGNTTMVPRTDEELSRLQALVEKAVGFNPDRGDQVEIQSMAFAVPPPEELLEEPADWKDWVRTLWRPILALILLGFVLIYMRNRKRRQTALQEVLSRPATVRELEANLASGSDKALAPGEEQKDGRAAALEPAKLEPARAAAVLRTWITES